MRKAARIDVPRKSWGWLAWPLAAKIAATTTLVVTAAGVSALAWGVANSGSGDEHTAMDDLPFGEAAPYVHEGSAPTVGEHWHSEYGIFLGDHRIEAFPEFDGGLSTAGDGIIHIKPLTNDDTGANATVARFIEAAGGGLTESELRLPDGTVLRNGDPVPQSGPQGPPGRPGRVFVLATEATATCDNLDLSGNYRFVSPDYVARDGECVRIAFTRIEALRYAATEALAFGDCSSSEFTDAVARLYGEVQDCGEFDRYAVIATLGERLPDGTRASGIIGIRPLDGQCPDESTGCIGRPARWSFLLPPKEGGVDIVGHPTTGVIVISNSGHLVSFDLRSQQPIGDSGSP